MVKNILPCKLLLSTKTAFFKLKKRNLCIKIWKGGNNGKKANGS